MDWLVAIQKWLYGGMAEGVRSATDVAGMPGLIALAFIFGIVHALMPGHGKSVLVSYHVGRAGQWSDGLMTGALLALTHVGTAALLLLAGVAVISRTVAAGGRAPAFETASAVMIVLIGVYLVAQLLFLRSRDHPADGRALAVVTGLVPCPLTTFILAYALAQGQLAAGIAAVFGLLLGVTVTLASVASAAVFARGGLVSLMGRTERFRGALGWSLELAGALGVLSLGVAMLTRRTVAG
jgi:ABC-type nickel/cobalt efflux system permease component RcnA